MKQALVFLFSLIGFCSKAQETPHLSVPKTHWKAFGFQKQVEQVAIGYYKSDSLGYEPAMLEVYTFNKDGHLIQKFMRIFGKYKSETAHNYVYNKGILDSINTFGSARNFNSKQKLHYRLGGIIDSVTATGVYTNFTDQYTYDSESKLASIERKYKNGGKSEAIFSDKNNYVHEKQTDLKGMVTEHYYIYEGDNLFASFFLGGRPVVRFYDAFHRSDFETEVNENALNYVMKWRKIKQESPEKFEQQMGELISKSSAKVILEFPAEAKNDHGDWTKRLQIDRRFQQSERRLLFKVLAYADGTVSGSSDFDLIFEKKVSKIK